ncbi:MAG: radical SAM protein [Promethearchaeota archaeon]
MRKKIARLDDGSMYFRELPISCLMCRRGQKMVLFIGGKCNLPQNCAWYCPISEKRRGKDDVYADEIKVNDPNDVIKEAKLIQAQGASITGGEPLYNDDQIELTLFYIEELKRVFSNNFHIHLYTNGQNLTPELAEELAKAGLDEIRFHPSEENFHKIEYALDLGMDVGAEVPVIPNEKYENYLWSLIDFLDSNGAQFLNLNEFEMNYMNNKVLLKRGYKLVEGSIANVKGSRELAEKLLKEFAKSKNSILNIHFCSIQAKDGTQLRNRYKRRAISIKYPYEEITKDGTLIFLQLEGNTQEINNLYLDLKNNFKIPKTMMYLEEKLHNSILNLPQFLIEEKRFIDLISKYKIKAGIVEILPFRGEYAEICEFTPINTLSKMRIVNKKSSPFNI